MTTGAMVRNEGSGSWARIASAMVGAWLFISAFAWRHSDAQLFNTWASGAAAVIFALVSLAAPQARYLNTALAIWLFISAFALPTASGSTTWNNAIVAVLLFAFSLVPERRRHPGAFTHHRRVTV